MAAFRLARSSGDQSGASLGAAAGSGPCAAGFCRALAGGGPDTGRFARVPQVEPDGQSALQRRYYLAKALVLEGKPDEAEKELQRLLGSATPLMPSRQVAAARQLLAELLSARGKFDEAARHLTQAVESQPIAFEQLTAVEPMPEADRPLIDRVRLLAEAQELELAAPSTSTSALAKPLTILANTRKRCGTTKWRTGSGQVRCASIASGGHMVRRPYRELYRRSLCPGAQNLTGRRIRATACRCYRRAARCGSTLVEQILSSHPAIAGGGELTFWLKRFSGWVVRVLIPRSGRAGKLAETYDAELRRIGPGALRVIDKELANFQFLGLLRLALPDARIIHCRRNPVDTCLSIFFADFQTRHDYAWDRGDLGFAFRQYERLMDHWRRVCRPTGSSKSNTRS